MGTNQSNKTSNLEESKIANNNNDPSTKAKINLNL